MSTSEKQALPTTATPLKPQAQPKRVKRSPLAQLIPLFALLYIAWTSAPTLLSHLPNSTSSASSAALLDAAKCPAQPIPLNVGTDWDPLNDEIYASLAAKRLSKSVQYPTESYDNMPLNASDPIFDKHFAFAGWLENEFSKIFNSPVKHEVINVHDHLFTWKGSNPDLKPIVLMAHTDTVPVLPATLDQWTFPPFEGKITEDATPETPGTWIWGRGSSDCKNSLLGIYGAVERLVSEGFQPERTIIISNGFDEEVGGPRGAVILARELEERYGPDSIALIVDEGFTGLSEEYGSLVASFGMAEKGSTNIDIKVETLGGHSSVPPPHTGIGIMSLLLAELEKNPFEPTLVPEGPYLKYLSCLSEYAPHTPKSLKSRVKNPKKWPSLAKELAGNDRKVNSFLATSQAIDLISGGVKVNALPEFVQATVNYRISFTSSVNETLEHVLNVLKPLVHSLNFTISAFDDSPRKSNSHISLISANTYHLEPSPITPSDSKSFALMAGTAKHVFGEKTIVSPSGMFANTDTKNFWNLSKHIYRFTPALITENLNQHTVNERISLEGHLNTTRFFYKLLQNSQGWETE
ncbi:hypothetical protein CI109_101724 [Kwoniella shandongensis]|uniref:Uncharacterized protein n=1 Tax=Kwoniella shandongensis TaxID=1734106 RepID=A0A5M6C984_9TREE|nr:uncharacterized protein CI109_001153 [Kwoniella shandongensis]KAA5530352.1 hypothetical protein CI109_001153 [Kwoniella shandongensis]